MAIAIRLEALRLEAIALCSTEAGHWLRVLDLDCVALPCATDLDWSQRPFCCLAAGELVNRTLGQD